MPPVQLVQLPVGRVPDRVALSVADRRGGTGWNPVFFSHYLMDDVQTRVVGRVLSHYVQTYYHLTTQQHMQPSLQPARPISGRGIKFFSIDPVNCAYPPARVPPAGACTPW